MATKAEMYREMADHATGNLTAQITDWVKFLLLAGKFYKYSFLDQVMIYTQRPTATACAGYDLWKQRMNRQVRYGSRGIALLDYRNGRYTLRYVFDVADTERRENGRDPVLWQYRDEYEGTVTSHLEECFKVPGGDGLLALGNAVSESAGVILRQVERAVKACMAGRAIAPPAPAQPAAEQQPQCPRLLCGRLVRPVLSWREE